MTLTEIQKSFNSRTLGRVRLGYDLDVVPSADVSIHAPWEGCDSEMSICDDQPPSFNSRTLGRVRQMPVEIRRTRLFVSIHAPWEGCDSLMSI